MRMWIEFISSRDRDQWRILVTSVTSLRVLQNAGNFLTDYATFNFTRTSIHGVEILVINYHYIVLIKLIA